MGFFMWLLWPASGFVEIGWVVTGLVWIRIGWFGGGVVIDDSGAVEVGVTVGGKGVGLLV